MRIPTTKRAAIEALVERRIADLLEPYEEKVRAEHQRLYAAHRKVYCYREVDNALLGTGLLVATKEDPYNNYDVLLCSNKADRRRALEAIGRLAENERKLRERKLALHKQAEEIAVRIGLTSSYDKIMQLIEQIV